MNTQTEIGRNTERSQRYQEAVDSRQSAEGRGGNIDDDQFVRQLRELVTVLRDKADKLEQCAAVDQPCLDDDDAGGRQCCRGLRCSAANRCVLACVPDGQSCRRNWFCCDGRRCRRRNGDFICE